MGENGRRRAKTGKRRLTWRGTLPRVTEETPETPKRWAKTWKRATSGENGQALLNVTRTRTLLRVTAETHENG
jgi:hypothetical protein